MTQRWTKGPEPALPLGLRGLPEHVANLDSLWEQLCGRLRAAAPAAIAGGRLAEDMHLQDTRALRLLIAYGRIRRRRHEVVGVAGSGYRWGGEDAAVYKAAAADAMRRGRCYLFLASLFKRQGTATAIAQLALDAVRTEALPGERVPDDLAALVAVEGVSVGDVLDALIGELVRTQAGQEALSAAVARHAEVILPEAVAQEIERKLDEIRSSLRGSRTARAG